MRRITGWLLLLLCAVLALAACDGGVAERVPPENYQLYENSELGISFFYPQTWTLRAESNAIVVTSLAGDITIDSAQQGGLLNLAVADTSRFGSNDPQVILDQFINQTGMANRERTAGPTALTIHEQPAATATFRGDEGNPILFEITVIVNGERLAAAAGGMPMDQEALYGPVLDTIIQSIQLTNP